MTSTLKNLRDDQLDTLASSLGQLPGIWTFEDFLVKFPAVRGQTAVRMPYPKDSNAQCLSSRTAF